MSELRRENIKHGMRVALYEGEARLAALDVFDLQMRVGHSAVRMGGIGGVGTERAHRGRGYARLVLDDTLDYMRTEGYAMSVLFGIPGFYPKWGFAAALVESTLEVPTSSALQAAPKLNIRPMQDSDLAAIARLYERDNAARTGSVVRPVDAFTGFWHGYDWNDNFAVLVIEDAGQVVGYAVYNSEPWAGQVAEVSCSSVAAMSSLIRALGERAHERTQDKVIITLPPDHALVNYCIGLGCVLKVGYPRWENGMARVIDQAALLRGIAPELTRRLQGAASISWRGTLVLRTPLGNGHVALGEGGEQEVRLSQESLTQLVLGFRAASDLFGEEQLGCEPAFLPVLEALFPRGYPYMWHPDRF